MAARAEPLGVKGGWPGPGLRRNLPMVFQLERNDCAYACLAMVAGVFGMDISPGSLRCAGGQHPGPASIEQLLALARQLGLHGRALRLNADEISNLAFPSILHWDLDHFVVLQSIRRKGVRIHDPAAGIRNYDNAELGTHFSGVAISFSRAAEYAPAAQKHRLTLSGLLGRMDSFARDVLQVFLLTLLIQVFALLSPLYLQLVIDQGVLKGDFDLVFLIAVMFATAMLARTVVTHIRGLAVIQLSSQLALQLSSNAFRHMLALPVYFFERRELGDIVSRFGSLDTIRQLVSQDMITALVDGFLSLITLCLLFFYSPLLASISLAVVLLFAVLRLFSLFPERQRREEALIAGARQQSAFMENIKSINVTKAYNIESLQIEAWENKFCQSLNTGILLGKFQLNLSSAQSLLFGLEQILVIYFGADLIGNGSLSLGQLLGYIFLKQQFIGAITAMLPKLAEFRLMRLELDRVADILLAERETESHAQSLFRPEIKGGLEAKELSFAFAGKDSKLLFSGVEFSLSPGQVLVISGASGSGKSSLLKIFAGRQRGYTGKFLVDGRPVQEINLKHYQDNIAAVFHEDKLIVGSLAFNINLDIDPGNIERLKLACMRAGVWETIEALPMQFATQVGELGQSFSAGQVQRILLARALYRQPRILLLDESLSHLPDEVALHIIANIKSCGITLVLVSHNKMLMQTADTQICLRMPATIRQKVTTNLSDAQLNDSCQEGEKNK